MMSLTWTAALALTLAPSASSLEIPVAKDASLIRSSLCCGPDAANRNFGATETVDSGRYHHEARALLAFDLTSITSVDQVWLVLPGSITGSGLPDFALSLVAEGWDENTVTYSTAPASETLSSRGSWENQELRFDVTESVKAALQEQRTELSFIVDAQGGSNLFIPARENKAGRRAAWLDVRP